MYKNFICYRGGSSAGILFAEDIYKRAKEEEEAVGRTYYSLYKEDSNEIRNFLNDPGAYLCEVTNFVMLLTKDFLGAFLLNGEPNPDSVTRIEIDEALKNKNLKFIPVVFPDFSWEGTTDGMVNKDILVKLWGEDAMRRIVGSPPIQFVFQYKKQVVEQILGEMDASGIIKNKTEAFGGNNISFRLESSPSVMPKRIFCGREEELAKIKEIFDGGDRILFLQGIGGIGKTEIAKQYAKRNKAQYDTLIYATYNSTVVELVSSQASFKIDPQFPRQVLSDGTQESDISYFKRKLDLIKEITNERTLIIIDNFDVMDDEYFSELTDAKYKLLITTRCDYSRLFPTIKIEPLDSIEQLKRVFLENYEGYMVPEDDPDLEELIKLVNRHTYTIELIAQHMENSGQTVAEMIEVLKKQGIVSLNEEVRGQDKTQVAYENLLKMFKVFELNDDDRSVLKVLSLMPLSGVDVKDLRNWMGVQALRSLRNLESRSWIAMSSNGIALHPIIRDVVRHELPYTDAEAKPFLDAFNETVKEEKSWHYPIGIKSYYADICSEIVSMFKEINENTLQLYKNIELLFSFGVKPGQAIEIGTRLFKYHAEKEGEGCYSCGYYSFQIGWCYLFNLQLVDSVKNAREWFNRSYEIFSKLELHTQDEFAAYGHLLSHLSRANLILFEGNGNQDNLVEARNWAMKCIENAEAHFDQTSPYYGRRAVAYMQLCEVLIDSKEFETALSYINDAYNIMFSLYGEDDPDTLNVSSRKSTILYNLGRYSEAYSLSRKNLETYDKFYGELNYLRFEQLMTAYRCCVQVGTPEEKAAMRESVLNIGKELLAEGSKQLEELKAL